MKEFITLCDGGLGNRLGAICGGLILGSSINYPIKICWPSNSWCGCLFDDLFNSNLEVLAWDINKLFRTYIKYTFMIHENQTSIGLPRRVHPSIEALEGLRSIDNGIIYYNNCIPPNIPEEKVIKVLESIKIKDYIIEEVLNFCLKHNIDNSTVGVHLRKSDNDQGIDESKLYETIKTSNQRYFLCSDDKTTEELFSKLPNIIIRPKNSYVTKLDPTGHWNKTIQDSESRIFPFNINREKDSVVEGFIDMLVLSRTTILFNTRSSFLHFAKRYHHITLG